VRLVAPAGYKSQDVIAEVSRIRPDVPVVINSQFKLTGTAASLRCAAHLSGDWLVTLDGDLLVTAVSMDAFLRADFPLLGVVPRSTRDAVGARVSAMDEVTDLGYDVDSQWEWSGLATLPRDAVLDFGDGHVFDSLRPVLPIATRRIDAIEIDHPEDILKASTWIENSIPTR